jgi:hypothetical protein
MDDRQKSELAMLGAVSQFGAENPPVPANAKATLHYATVSNAKDIVLAKAGLQVLAKGEFRAASASRHTVVKDLRVKLRELAATAKALDSLGVKPGLVLQFRMPKWTMQDLRDKAVAFKDAMEPIKQDFIDYGSETTVVEDLEAAIAAFDAATGGRYSGILKHVGATATIASLIRQGVAAVRGLDAILIKRYRNDPGKLAEWKAAQRIAAWPSQPKAPVETPDAGAGI